MKINRGDSQDKARSRARLIMLRQPPHQSARYSLILTRRTCTKTPKVQTSTQRMTMMNPSAAVFPLGLWFLLSFWLSSASAAGKCSSSTGEVAGNGELGPGADRYH